MLIESVDNLLEKLVALMQEDMNKYFSLRRELGEHIEKLNDMDELYSEKAHELFVAVQFKFCDLLRVINFVVDNHENLSGISMNHQEFMKSIKELNPNSNFKKYTKEPDGTYREIN
jgi:hypothetical protein